MDTGHGRAVNAGRSAAVRDAPAVSVLLPVRDGMPHLSEAMASISAQTFADFEVVAVDDGSTDGSLAALLSWARSDRRVRVLSQDARGLVPALERARRAARGRYLARMDADDRAFPSRLAKQFRMLEARPGVGLCGTHVRYFPTEAVRGGARRYERWLNGLDGPEALELDLFVECPLAHPTFFMRAAAVDAVGGYRDPGWPEDYDLLLRLWEAGYGFDVVPEVLHEWRESPGRRSRTHPAYRPEAFRRCKVHFLGRTHLSGGRPVVIWGAGPTGKAFGRALLAAGHPVRAWVDVDPRKVGQTVHGAPVLAPRQIEVPTEALMLAAVGSARGRRDVRNALRDLGLCGPQDVVAVA